MTDGEILSKIDHTLLKPSASREEIKALCEEGVNLKTASVCIPPCYVTEARSFLKNRMSVCTVIGFPLGYNSAQVKLFEAQKALDEGADEIDMVINITDVKNKAFDKIFNEIAQIKKAAGKKILKVIVETCFLANEEKIKMCEIINGAGADYIKTSTGFGSAGAAIEDIALFKKHLGDGVKIKASGGIRSRESMVMFIEAGCSRIGTSSAGSLKINQ